MKKKRADKAVVSKKKRKSDVEILSDSEGLSSVSEESVTEEEFRNETPHERKIRLTKKIIAKAKEKIGSDEEQLDLLSSRLREEALVAKGKFVTKLAHKCHRLEPESVLCLRAHKRAVSAVCVSDDCRFIFSGGKDSSIIKWNFQTFEKLAVIHGGRRGSNYAYHTGPVLSLAVSSDCKYLASSSMDETVIIWDPETMKIVMKLKRHQAAVAAVAFRRYSHMLFTADCRGRVCVWNMPLSEILQDQGARTNIEVLGLCGLLGERCVSCSGISAPGICLWKVPEEVCVQYSVKDSSEIAIECVYAVNDEVFVGGSTANKLYVWHSSRGSPVFTVSPAHPFPKRLTPEPEDSQFHYPVASWVTAISGLAGTDLIATGSSTGHVQLWQVVLPGHFHGESITGAQDQTLRTQIKLQRLSECSLSLFGFINSLAFSLDRRFLVVGLGQEHRMGKWEPRRPLNPAVCLIPLKLPTTGTQWPL